MRVLFWNVNGVAKVEAGLKLRDLVYEYKPVVLCIAEPKIHYSDSVMLRLYLISFTKTAIHNSTSSLGNFWILWSEEIEEPVVINMTRQAITVKTEGVMISFVHASYIQVFRWRLWSQLAAVDSITPWLIMGDFNCVLRNDEKKGGREPRTSCISEFSDWMEENNLFEADSLGSKFTWTNGQSGGGRILSNLDRAIINEPWLAKFLNWRCKALPREVSDHSTLIGYPFVSPRPRRAPFRIQKMWFMHPDFLRMVEASWNAPVYGNPDFIFPFKLKRLKEVMKLWNQQVFGNVNARLKQAQLKFEVESRNSDEDTFKSSKLNVMKDALVDVQDVQMQHHIMLKQKSRNKWLLEGSSNTSYFHSTINIRRSTNTISELVTEEGTTITETDQLRNHESQMLDDVPSIEEIHDAVFDLGADSAPGPDGFSRVRGADSLRKFRPIGLSNFFFKIFTKILATRLGKVLGRLVSEEQVAFMKGRNIHENITRASELVNELHIKRKDGNLGLKLDISQAFDTISWPFVMKGNMKSLTNLVKLLDAYQRASVQRVCREKSKIYYGGGSLNRRQYIADYLGMEITYFPDRCLGVKVMSGVVKYAHISNVVYKLKDQLSVLKGKMLSFQDRVVLIKTVLSNYSIHNMAVPVKEGGLSLTSLRTMNKALLMKLWWNVKTSNKKWARYLKTNYTYMDGRIKLAGVKSTIFPSIRWVHQVVDRNTKSLIGDGRTTSLYYDVWYGTVALAEVLNRTDLDMNARVSDIIVQGAWQLQGVHLNTLSSAGFMLDRLPSLRVGCDKKIWMPDLKGDFSVRSARELIRTKYPIMEEAKLLWKKVMHPSLAAQNWKFIRGACATLDKVRSRFKIALASKCRVCQNAEESLEHVLWSCSFATRDWNWMEGIFGIKTHYNLLVSYKNATQRSGIVQDLWLVANLVVRSELWFTRNKKVYEKKTPCWSLFQKRVFNLVHEYSVRTKNFMHNSLEDLKLLDFFRVRHKKVKHAIPKECYWEPPNQNELLLCTDGTQGAIQGWRELVRHIKVKHAIPKECYWEPPNQNELLLCTDGPQGVIQGWRGLVW
ncbi:uncharacterized protein LOC113342252 [Papaver somniferum]|uniref:uncharacterized protein LOC113342252 n=1 Tax=Papaver somniferum TaxID=3469 RepID=UPI000E6F5F93|nr:uncharacterized protein LOC113342252 [Papaver somniferum]